MPVIYQNYSLTQRNTLQLAASCAAYSRVDKTFELAKILSYAAKHQLRVIPLGDGSNVVLADLPDTLIVDVALKGISILEQNDQHIRIKVMAGENWHNLVNHCVAKGWHGLENLALIPGRVGAAPVQNIGAYGVEVREFINQVTGVRINSKSTTANTQVENIQISNDNCYFGYRDSIFKHALRDQILITSVELTLSKQYQAKLDYPALRNYFAASSDTPRAKQVMDAVIAIRSSKLPDPSSIPNVGSFFKNPVIDQTRFDHFIQLNPDAPWYVASQASSLQRSNEVHYKLAAGWLIEQCGFKGLKQGVLAMHNQQALVLTHCTSNNEMAADAKQVLNFANQIIEAVKKRFAVTLEIEPRCY